MLTSILRIILTRSLCPFVFKSGVEDEPDPDLKNLGLYIHIPFCRKLCSFCPYYKVKYEKGLMDGFVRSLLKEIDLIKKKENRKYTISSIYFGGGSPALAAEYLPEIMSKIKTEFDVNGNAGIELHPRDIDLGLLRTLSNNGFDMVSIGVQSFREKCLLSLGREIIDSERKIRMTARAGFKVIDTDLIFGIPGQTQEDLVRDFETAAKYGATQISTYPFIEFSYSGLRERPAGKDMQKKMLECLLEISRKIDFERGSVWTFIKKGSKPYTSVTRDNFIGMGASAATLTRHMFKINTFSVNEYISCLSQGRLPTALVLKFNDRRRALYWLFWSAYNLQLDRKSFRELFGFELDLFFKPEIFMGKRLGLLEENERGYGLTEKGADLYHAMEQIYTHQYIDKTWRISQQDPWPEKLVLY